MLPLCVLSTKPAAVCVLSLTVAGKDRQILIYEPKGAKALLHERLQYLIKGIMLL